MLGNDASGHHILLILPEFLNEHKRDQNRVHHVHPRIKYLEPCCSFLAFLVEKSYGRIVPVIEVELLIKRLCENSEHMGYLAATT